MSLVVLFANAITAMLLVGALLRARRERDYARAHVDALLARQRSGPHRVVEDPLEMLALIDMHRPMGVSLRRTVDALQDALAKGNYP